MQGMTPCSAPDLTAAHMDRILEALGVLGAKGIF
jgi:hypothetical protein